MANLLVTWRCNRCCTYCFARDRNPVASDPARNSDLTVDCLERALEFFLRSNLSVVGILGGEPGLHPNLPGILDRLLAEGLAVRLFTGGVMSENVARFLAGTDPQRVRIVINMPGTEDLGPPSTAKAFWRTMHLLSGRGALGYTIRAPGEDLRFLADVADAHGMRDPLRIGLASPCIDDPAPPLLPPENLVQLAPLILDLAEQCSRRDIELEFDCGFPRCMFTEAEHDRLRGWKVHAAFHCGPIVDIGPDLSAWSCFPLKAMGMVQFGDQETREDLFSRLGRQQQAYRNFGIYDRCLTCSHKRTSECSGGCLAHVVRSFRA